MAKRIKDKSDGEQKTEALKKETEKIPFKQDEEIGENSHGIEGLGFPPEEISMVDGNRENFVEGFDEGNDRRSCGELSESLSKDQTLLGSGESTDRGELARAKAKEIIEMIESVGADTLKDEIARKAKQGKYNTQIKQCELCEKDFPAIRIWSIYCGKKCKDLGFWKNKLVEAGCVVDVRDREGLERALERLNIGEN